MKRSEVVEQIEHVLSEMASAEDRDKKKFEDEYIADLILYKIESVGMLPPLNEQNYHHMDNDSRREINAATHYYQWEAEDEEK